MGGRRRLLLAGLAALLAWPHVAVLATEQRGLVVVLDESQQQVVLYRESHALLIGAADYSAGWPKLHNVPSDIREVRAALEGVGFQVVVVEDPDAEELRRAYSDFIGKYGNDPENRLLFYFAGHGHTLKHAYGDTMGYIVPVDAPNPNVNLIEFRARALDMQQMEVYARRIQSKHALFLFDSCFSGSIFSLSRAIPESISYKTGRPVRQFITSGSADETVPDESIFRAQLLTALSGDADGNSDGYLTGTELGEFLSNSVANYSRGTQHPQYGKIRHSQLDKGDFVFPLATGSAASSSVTATEPLPSAPPAPVAFLGHVQVNVNTRASVFLDGKLVGEAVPGQPLNQRDVPSGRSTLRVQAPGYDPESREVEIRRGQWTQLAFELQPFSSSEASSAPPESKQPPYPRLHRVDPDSQEHRLAVRIANLATQTRDVPALREVATLPFFLHGKLLRTEGEFDEAWRDRIFRPDYPRATRIVEIGRIEIPADGPAGVHPQLEDALHALRLGGDEILLGWHFTNERVRKGHSIVLLHQADGKLRMAGTCCMQVEFK